MRRNWNKIQLGLYYCSFFGGIRIMLDSFYQFENITLYSERYEKNKIILIGMLDQNTNVCPNCGQSSMQHIHKHENVKYKDLNIGDKKVVLELEKTWYRCQHCGKCYPAMSKDLDDSRRMTTRLVRYAGLLCASESFDTVSQVTGISKGTLTDIYWLHIQHKMIMDKSVCPDVLLVGEVYLKSRFCTYVASLQPTSFLGIIPNPSSVELMDFLNGKYGESSPKILYCAPFKELVEGVKSAFPTAKLIVDPRALLRVAQSTENTLKRKYSVKITGTAICRSIPYCLNRVSISPYDLRFIERHSWLEELLLVMNGKETFAYLNAHIKHGKSLFDKVMWEPFSILEEYPEIIYNYRTEKFSKSYEAAYLLIENALTSAMHCKTFERAVSRLLFTDNLNKVHKNVLKGQKAGMFDIEQMPESPDCQVEKIFTSDKYAKIDAYHKLELISREYPELYNYAYNILLYEIS